VQSIILDAAYWQQRYTSGNKQWDIGTISQPLKAYFDQLLDKNVSILIPGCGNGYEAKYLLSTAFNNVTVIDIVSDLVTHLSEELTNYGNKFKGICGDFFTLNGKYDLIVEQTFFCALQPNLRQAYAEKMKSLLTPNGKLVGLLFNRNFEQDGPPFGGDLLAYQTLFQPHFSSITMLPCYNSIAPRAGKELFIKLSQNK